MTATTKAPELDENGNPVYYMSILNWPRGEDASIIVPIEAGQKPGYGMTVSSETNSMVQFPVAAGFSP